MPRPSGALHSAAWTDPSARGDVHLSGGAVHHITLRERAHRGQHHQARALTAAVVREHGTLQLPVKALRELLELWRGSGDIAFGDRGVVDLVRLRALLRQCAGLDSTIITLTENQLVIAYTTTRARGLIRLVLRAREDHDKVLVVPIPVLTGVVAVHHAVAEPAPWPVDDAQHASSPQPPLPPRRPVLVLVR